MNAIVSFRKCTLSDDELLEKVDQVTDILFDYKHKHERERVLSRHVPARPNSDYDLIVGELIVRHKWRVAAADQAKAQLVQWAKSAGHDTESGELADIVNLLR